MASAFSINQCVSIGFLNAVLSRKLLEHDVEREYFSIEGRIRYMTSMYSFYGRSFGRQRFINFQFGEGDSLQNI